MTALIIPILLNQDVGCFHDGALPLPESAGQMPLKSVWQGVAVVLIGVVIAQWTRRSIWGIQ